MNYTTDEFMKMLFWGVLYKWYFDYIGKCPYSQKKYFRMKWHDVYKLLLFSSDVTTLIVCYTWVSSGSEENVFVCVCKDMVKC